MIGRGAGRTSIICPTLPEMRPWGSYGTGRNHHRSGIAENRIPYRTSLIIVLYKRPVPRICLSSSKTSQETYYFFDGKPRRITIPRRRKKPHVLKKSERKVIRVTGRPGGTRHLTEIVRIQGLRSPVILGGVAPACDRTGRWIAHHEAWVALGLWSVD